MVSQRRVLVVDDEPLVNASCRRVLGTEGYDVETTESGQDGLSRACTRPYDVVITDLKMPDLDGMDLIRQLHRRHASTPILVITGYGSIASAVEVIQLGARDYIEKPFTPDRLIQAVHDALAEEPAEGGGAVEIDADLVRKVLARASRDGDFADTLLTQGSSALPNVDLSPEAKAAIVSGDIGWLEAHVGPLSAEQREWLARRLQAEIW